MSNVSSLPVAVIGAGPVGLAAAAHLAGYRQSFVVLEAGPGAGASVREWGHVRMFSPWRYNVDRAARELLEAGGWEAPDPDSLPTGAELVDRLLEPLATHPALAPHIRFNGRVTSIGRKDFDKVRTKGRDQQPFEIRLASGETILARAVIDATGTWSHPNPAASGGLPASGERECDRVAYGIPDVLGRERGRYVGQRVLVVGSGHSAFNVVIDLLTLSAATSGTSVVWAMRRDNLDTVWGGGTADALQARGELGQRARRAVEAGLLRVLTPYRIRSIDKSVAGLVVTGAVRDDDELKVHVDQVIVCTGFRPDFDLLKEIRLSTDPWLESSSALGPLIDPNEHSCGTVRPHGARELTHPEKDFFIVGMKSYGRAPTFLLATGYEQARSVVALLAGDVAAAERVELDLPETGVCSVGSAAAGEGCCGGPAPHGVDACCVADATAKAAGDSGCGCGSPKTASVHVSTRQQVPVTV